MDPELQVNFLTFRRASHHHQTMKVAVECSDNRDNHDDVQEIV